MTLAVCSAEDMSMPSRAKSISGPRGHGYVGSVPKFPQDLGADRRKAFQGEQHFGVQKAESGHGDLRLNVLSIVFSVQNK